jgi:hypothetical protein
MKTDKLVPYKQASYPVIPGGEAKYISSEFRKVENAVRSSQQIMKNLEAAGSLGTKAGAVAASDIADGSWQIIHDTVNATVGLYANVGGTLFKVMLA